MRLMEIDKLMPGMIVAKDVLSFNGLLLVNEGEALQGNTIRRLLFHGITSIYVEDGTAPKPPFPDPPNTYLKRIQSDPGFTEFKNHYEEAVDEFRDTLNALVEKNTPLDTDTLLSNTLALFPQDTSGIPVFDMLQNMRQYDDVTFNHSLNVALICNMFAQWLKFSEEEIHLATLCGLLHDVGKLMVPPGIIKKPSKLTPQEFDVVKQHTTAGYRFLTGKNVDVHIRNAALMHHEKCDGSGYPNGLHSRQIDRYAKLVTIADIYDAMTAARIYRGPLCPFQVIRAFEEEGLQKYDPRFIMTFLDRVANTYIQNHVLLNNGIPGEIVMTHRHNLSRPLVKTEHEILDLRTHPELEIERIL